MRLLSLDTLCEVELLELEAGLRWRLWRLDLVADEEEVGEEERDGLLEAVARRARLCRCCLRSCERLGLVMALCL